MKQARLAAIVLSKTTAWPTDPICASHARPRGDLRYSDAEKLPPVINNDDYRDGSPFVAPDESYLLFVGGRRPDALGGDDIYISLRGRSGQWTAPVNLGEPINSGSHDMCPIVSPDGKYFFFHSQRSGSSDIYWMDSGFLESFRRTGI